MNDTDLTPRQWLTKVITVRKRIITEERSQKNKMKSHTYINILELWLKAWTSATNEQVLNFIRLRHNEIRFLIPGNSSGCGPKMMAQLEEYLNTQKAA